MIRIDPEAALEMIEARAYYRSRGGDHEAFTIAAIQLIDEIEANPTTFAPHPFATTPGTRRALFQGHGHSRSRTSLSTTCPSCSRVSIFVANQRIGIEGNSGSRQQAAIGHIETPAKLAIRMIDQRLGVKFRRDRPFIESNVKGGSKAMQMWIKQ